MSTYRGPMNKLRIAVIGPRGRMGRAVLETLAEREDLEVAAGLGRGDRLDAGAADVAVDFTTPESSVAWAQAAAEGAARPW
jgi:4-hydroxy-tetrahydrodipicolinate reductase